MVFPDTTLCFPNYYRNICFLFAKISPKKYHNYHIFFSIFGGF